MKNRGVRRAESFGGLFESHVDAVFEAAWLVVRNRDVAALITQHTYADAWPEFRAARFELAHIWLLARARDRAFDWLQANDPAGLRSDVLESDAIDDAVLGPERRARIAAALEQLGIPVRGEPPDVPRPLPVVEVSAFPGPRRHPSPTPPSPRSQRPLPQRPRPPQPLPRRPQPPVL